MKRWRPENSLEECAVLRGRERLSEQNHVLPDHFKGGRPGSIKKWVAGYWVNVLRGWNRKLMTGLEGKQTAPMARSHSASRISSEPSLAAGVSEHFGDLCGLLLNGVPDPEVDIPRLMLDGVTFL